MIVYYLNRFCAIILPFKTNTVLIIYSNTVLTLTVSCQSLQHVSRRYFQILNKYCGIELIQFASSNFPNMYWANFTGSFGILAVKNIFRSTIFE